MHVLARIVSRLPRLFTVVCLFFFSLSQAYAEQSADRLTAPMRQAWKMAVEGEVLRIGGDRLAAILGAPRSHYLFTVRDKEALRIATHQIEAGDLSLWPVSGDSVRPASESAAFTREDVLLLSAQDLGLPWSGEHFPAQTPQALMQWLSARAMGVYEVRLLGPETSSYGYVWRLSEPVPARFVSAEDVVAYDAQTHFAETAYYSLAAHLENPLEWQDLVVGNMPSDQPATLLDRLKMQLRAVTLGNTSVITLNNNSIRGEVVSVSDGPLQVRVLINAKAIFGGAVVGRARCQLVILPKSVMLEVVSRVPEWVSYMLSEASLTLSLDGADLYGGRVTASGTPLGVGHVDGQMSGVESLFSKTGFRSRRYWWHLSLPSGVELHSRLQLLSPEQLPVTMVYTDDHRQHIASDRFAGQVPNIGYQIGQLPLKTPFAMVLSLRFDHQRAEYALPTYLEALSAPLVTEVRVLGAERLNKRATFLKNASKLPELPGFAAAP